MKRSDVILEVAKLDGLIVANLGHPSRELYALGDSARNFYMLGSMGLASSIGLGLACGQDKQVYALDGDGSILMNMGTLATIAHQAPANYCLIIVDNKAYGSTGNQPTCTAQKTDLAAVARGAGNREVKRVKSIAQLRTALRLLKNKSSIIVAETDCSAEPAPVIPLTPLQIRDRFMGKIRR